MTCRSFLTRTACPAALIAALSASPVAADLTGPQVWEDWKTYMRGFGYEMSGTESQSGGELAVSDVIMSVQFPEDAGSFEISLSSLTFVDNADGSVSVEMPTSMPMTFDVRPPEGEGEPARGTLLYTQTNPTMVVSGDPDDMTYTYDVQAVGLTLDALEVDGEVVPRESMAVSFEMTDVSSVTRMQIGEMRGYDQNMTAGGLTYDVAFVVPEEDGGGRGSVQGGMQALTITGGGQLPMTGDSSDLNAMLEAGMTVSGGFAYEAGNTQIDMQPPEGPLVGSTSSDGGTIEVAMGPDGLQYDVRQTNLSVDMQQLPDVPFPVSLQMAESALNVTMPVQTRDEPQDFAFGLTLGGFRVTDAIWNLFDPAGQLPRDPATISVDLGGKAKMLVDIMDPEATAAMQPGAAPGELHALDIRNLLISVVGAKATGSGAFTFDNTDTTTFNGMPKPLGSLNVRVEGANALIDKLVQMGLLPEDQAMGARMMMGMFGVPAGDDVLTSTIEINEQGHVLANGQRLQ